MVDPILLMGGTGAIGELTAQALRRIHPDVPLLIGGRDLTRSRTAADALGNAEGVQIDPKAEDLGIGDRAVSAVAVFYADHRLAGLQYAINNGIPHLGISSGVFEIAPEVALYMRRPNAAAIVLGYEWLVGATTIATLACAQAFAQVDTIAIGALVDEQDGGGPAVAADFERLGRLMPNALARRDGAWCWREGEDRKTEFRAIDGSSVPATGFSQIDVASLAAETGAANVRFDLATGISSSRRRGAPKSTEILIELEGKDAGGRSIRTRHAVFHPEGAAPLTALGTSAILERLTGLAGQVPIPAGLYFPYQVLDHGRYLEALRQAGGDIVRLDP
jgi:hypothetical protein